MSERIALFKLKLHQILCVLNKIFVTLFSFKDCNLCFVAYRGKNVLTFIYISVTFKDIIFLFLDVICGTGWKYVISHLGNHMKIWLNHKEQFQSCWGELTWADPALLFLWRMLFCILWLCNLHVVICSWLHILLFSSHI